MLHQGTDGEHGVEQNHEAHHRVITARVELTDSGEQRRNGNNEDRSEDIGGSAGDYGAASHVNSFTGTEISSTSDDDDVR